MTAADILAELVAIPTQQAGPDGIAGDEKRICEHLAPMLRARGADDVIVGDGRRSDGKPGAFVFARWGTPRRIINAHVDTVPANAGWTRDPWTPHIENGRLYGLGSADTKGAIAATLVALEHKPTDVGVLFSGDEEAGSAIMEAFLASPLPRGIEQAIVCEPTARIAGTSHRGVLGQSASLEGMGGHSSKADTMPKPLVMLARLAIELDGFGVARLHDGPPGMTGLCMNIAALHGGVAFNVIPQRGLLEWSLRQYPKFDRAGWDADVAAAAARIRDNGLPHWLADRLSQGR
jgi:acetylornithine deacetylase